MMCLEETIAFNEFTLQFGAIIDQAIDTESPELIAAVVERLHLTAEQLDILLKTPINLPKGKNENECNT